MSTHKPRTPSDDVIDHVVMVAPKLAEALRAAMGWHLDHIAGPRPRWFTDAEAALAEWDAQ